VVSIICKPEAVVMPFFLRSGPRRLTARGEGDASHGHGKWRSKKFLKVLKTSHLIQFSFVASEKVACAGAALAQIAEGAQPSLRGSEPPVSVPFFPVDPDRLTAAERGDQTSGLMPKLPQALDDIGGDAVLELIDIS